MSKKGQAPLFDEDAYDPTAEGVTPEAETKKEMFEQDTDNELKVEPKSARIPMFYVEPSLKQRLADYVTENDVKQSVVLRAAVQEFLEKRGF